MSQQYVRPTPADSAIVLVDHQPGVLAMVGSLPASVIATNAALLGRLGEELGLALLITSTREKAKTPSISKIIPRRSPIPSRSTSSST